MIAGISKITPIAIISRVMNCRYSVARSWTANSLPPKVSRKCSAGGSTRNQPKATPHTNSTGIISASARIRL